MFENDARKKSVVESHLILDSYFKNVKSEFSMHSEQRQFKKFFYRYNPSITTSAPIFSRALLIFTPRRNRLSTLKEHFKKKINQSLRN